MMRAPSFCGVVLSAGESSRMGRDKALLPWPPLPEGVKATSRAGTFLSGQIELLQRYSDLVIVVAGANLERIRPITYSVGASIVQNPSPEQGQFSSLRCGLQEVLNRGRDAAIVTLVDRPPCAAATVAILRQAFAEALSRGIWAVVPEHGGRHGHPILVGREMISAFLAASPHGTAREVEHANQQHLEYIVVEDPLVAVNIDTPADYERLRAVEYKQ
jgi:molybdenum cofactor cytidylyltransferase